jgi:hypothetical protein
VEEEEERDGFLVGARISALLDVKNSKPRAAASRE